MLLGTDMDHALWEITTRSLSTCGGTGGSTGLRLLFGHEPSDHGLMIVVIVLLFYIDAFRVSIDNWKQQRFSSNSASAEGPLRCYGAVR